MFNLFCKSSGCKQNTPTKNSNEQGKNFKCIYIYSISIQLFKVLRNYKTENTKAKLVPYFGLCDLIFSKPRSS